MTGTDTGFKSVHRRAPIGVAVAVLMVGVLLCAVLEKNRVGERKSDARDTAARVTRQVDQHLTQNLAATYALAALVRQGGGAISEFDALAGEFLTLYPSVSSLQLAPDGVIRQVVPLRGNEKAIGHNLMADERRNKEALLAKVSGRLTLAGPFELIQGGEAMIGRLPVFLGKDQFWGFTIALIRMQGFLDATRIADLERRGYSYELWRTHPDSGARHVFARSTTALADDPVTAYLDVPNGRWHLSLAPAHGWVSGKRLAAELFFAALFAVAIGWWAHLYLRANVALAESGVRYRMLYETTPAMMHSIDASGRLVSVSQFWLDKLGYTRNEVIGRKSADFLTEESRRHAVEVVLPEFFRTGRCTDVAYQMQTKAGDVLDVSLSAIAERDADGRIVRSLAVIQDVTARKRADAALQASEQRLKEAQRIAQLGSWQLDLTTQAVTCSDEVLAMFELDATRGTPVFDAVLERVHPDDRERIRQSFIESIKNHRPFDTVHRVQLPDGTVKYVHERSQATYGEDGRAVSVVGTVQDVTLQQLNEEALRESEERFKTVADYNYDWEYWVGPSRQFLYLSPSCQRITGYAQYEFIADASLVERIIHPDDRRLFADHLADYRDEKEHSLDFRIVGKDGTVRWIAHGCRPVFGRNGEFMGRRVSNRDITGRKLAEEALQDAKERLALALEASLLSLWDLDVSDGTVLLDRQWAELMGLPVGTTLTTTAQLAGEIHPDDLKRVMPAALATIAGTAPDFQQEFRCKAASGEWKWIRCSGKVIGRDAAGRALRAIGTNLDITERKNAEEQIHQFAYYDTLTGLPNRRLLVDRLNQVLSQARRFTRALAIMFLDLDRFKEINDTRGHDVGDELLRVVAVRLARCMRVGDTVSRQGGDEFVVVLAEIAHPGDAVRVAEKIVAVIAEPIRVGGHELHVTTSVGIVIYPADGSDDAQELMKKADIAMYEAKNAGRNCYRVFDGAAHCVVPAAAEIPVG